MSVKVHTIWNLAGSAVPLLVAAATVPFLMQDLGVEKFGVLTLIWTLIGYFSLFDLGLGRAITHHISTKIGKLSGVELANRITIGLFYTLVAGLIGTIIVLIIADPLSSKWLKVSPLIQAEIHDAFLYAAMAIPFVALSSGLKGILEAYGHFDCVNIVRIFQGACTFAFPMITVSVWGPDLGPITLSLCASRVIVLVMYFAQVRKRLGDHWVPRFNNLAFDSSLLHFGAWMTLSNIISPLLIYLDRFVITSVIGGHAVAFYTVPFEMLTRLLIVPGAMGAALFPKLSTSYHSNSSSADYLLKYSILSVALVMGVLCSAVYMLYQPIVSLWLSADFAHNSSTVVGMLLLGIWANSIGFVIYTGVQAKTGAKQTALLHLTEFILFIPLLYLLLLDMGIKGAAIAWTCRVAFDAVAMYVLLKKSSTPS